MEAHIHEWLNLLLRWIHFIVGIAWIGASFYFNWLENNLERKLAGAGGGGIAGELWAVHGGGFYHVRKFEVAPDTLPRTLHWFKWEAYATWLSGVALLVVIYYFNARLYMVDPEVAALRTDVAIAIGVAAMIGAWFGYDLLCRSPLRRHPRCLTFALFVLLLLLAVVLAQYLSGRAAYIHVGAAIGTMMVGNVLFVIIPAQRELVRALREGGTPDPEAGRNGLLRSRHNNYLTLPVLFIMISSHFPSTYGHHWNWLILVLLSVTGVAVRHYFNVRHAARTAWMLPLAFLALVGVMWLAMPGAGPGGVGVGAVTTAQIMPVVRQRCTVCHSAAPTQPGIAVSPAGLVLDTIDSVELNAALVFNATVITRTMPLANISAMTEEERAQIRAWFTAFNTRNGQ